MGRTAGIPLVDLFDVTDRINAALPQSIQDFIDRFSVAEYRSTRSPGAVIHHGKLQSLAGVIGEDVEEFDIGIGKLTIPLINAGLPFQLSMVRSAIPAGSNLEPAAAIWALDLKLDRLVLALNALEPAIFVEETGTAPRHIVRNPDGGEVRIIGSATLRIEKTSATDPVAVRFVDESDPFDPTTPTGAVASLYFSPPHFFFGKSDFGMSVGKLEFDFSETYSTPEVIGRGQGPDWTGLAIQEATLYAPRNLPGIGDLSGGVKNVLIGNPLGIQGEVEVQFGRTALDPSTFRFRVDDSTTDITATETVGLSRTVPIEAAQDQDVTIHAGFTASAPPEGGAIEDWTARWQWPDGTVEIADSSSGQIRHAQDLKVTPIEKLSGGEEINHPEVTFRFVMGGTGAAVQATIGSETFDNVVDLNGRAAAISAITLTAISTATGTTTYEWEVVGTERTGTGTTFSPDVSGLTGTQKVLLREIVDGNRDEARISHVWIRIEDNDRLLVGTEGGVFDAVDDGTVLELSAAELTYDLSDFHGQGVRNEKLAQATLDPTAPAKVSVPGDGLAEVVLDEGGSPAEFIADRHVQIHMKFDDNVVIGWGEKTPKYGFSSGDVNELRHQLLEWASHYPNAHFIVIGRCDDIGSDGYNETLATKRAKRGFELLTDSPPRPTSKPAVPTYRVSYRGEQSSSWTDNPPVSVTPSPPVQTGAVIEDKAILALEAKEKTDAVGDASLENGRLIEVNENRTGWPSDQDTSHPAEGPRITYRRVDIYALEADGETVDPASLTEITPRVDPTRRRSMVPAAGRATSPVPSTSPAIDYRVKLKLGWDRPTASGWEDAIPNLAEAEFAWSPAEAPMPPVNGSPPDLSKEVLTFYAKWIYDDLTQFTRLTLGIKSDGDPNGLFYTQQKQLTAAAAFGPMLLAGVDLDDDVVGSGARISALLAAVAFADTPLGSGNPPLLGDDSKTAVMKIEAQIQTTTIADPGPGIGVKLLTDYVCTLHINGGVLGIKTADDKPVKIRYKNVGLEFDNSKEGWEKFGLAFATDSLEIEDPGRWEIEGVLGELLRIVEISMGRGSLWIEGRIAIALNLGVIEISEAIIRLIFEDGSPIPKFELRGFVLKAEIPNVLEGEGRLRIEDGGVIRAGVEVDLPAIGVGGTAAIALGKPPEIDPDIFMSLFLGVQFATPIPLAQSGAAIYGFKGMFAMNGSRNFDSIPTSDPIGKELAWWREPPENKYGPESGQYALGVGVVVGTLPDVSFCFSASGMVVVAFPDPEVILGVDVKVIEVPDTTATDEGGAEGTITGLIVIDDTAVKVAVSAQYEIPKILSLKVPFGAYFPYSLQGTYVRLGSDGVTASIPDGSGGSITVTRHGEPITLTILPGTLNSQAWAYLMIEQDGLPSLGGDARFSFEGFSVGFGTGWGIEWSAGPIKLSASAKVLVGFGTDPLLIKGGIFVAGELDLVVLSISARGEIILTYFDDNLFLEGEFCGEVDLFFFSIKGCVSFKWGTDGDPVVPAPDGPVANISLTDRRDRIMGEAAPVATGIAAEPLFRMGTSPSGDDINTGVAPKDNHTVWPDTAPIIHFRHKIENAIPAGEQFQPGPTGDSPLWWGSSRLKYAYQLNNVILRRKSDLVEVASLKDTPDVPPLQSVWTSTPYKQPDGSGVDGNPLPGEHEGPNLKLLDWDPWKWVINHNDGGEGTNGDPAEEIEDLCEEIPRPRRACVYGRAARGLGPGRVRIRPEQLAPPPYPSKFFVTGEPALPVNGQRIAGRPLQMLMARSGARFIPGGIRPLPFPVPVEGETLSRGYRLPSGRRAMNGGLLDAALPWEGVFDREVSQAQVTLLVCDAPGQVGETNKTCYDFEDAVVGQEDFNIVLPPVTLRSLVQDLPLVVMDSIDGSRQIDAKFGSDGKPDIRFPNRGMEMFLREPTRALELYFMKSTNSQINVAAIGTSGQVVATEVAQGPQGQQLVVRFATTDPIVRLRVTGGGGEAWLFRICRTVDTPGGQPLPPPNCEDFRDLKPGSSPVSFDHNGFKFGVLNRPNRLNLVDLVNQRGGAPTLGRDKGAEILFPDGGMIGILPKPCKSIELWIMHFAGKPAEAEAISPDDKVVDKGQTSGKQRIPQRIVLTAPEGELISEFRLTGGAGEAILFRICCSEGEIPKRDCITFRGFKLEDGMERAFVHAGHGFATINRDDAFALADAVSQSRSPAEPGSDRVPELRFPDDGMVITLPAPCTEVTVKAMTFGGALKAEARDALGARVDGASTSSVEKVEHVLTFEGEGIETITIFGGRGEAVIYEICCSGKGSAGDGDTGGTGGTKPPADLAIPMIQTLEDGTLSQTNWSPVIRSTRTTELKRTCRVITYTVPRGTDPVEAFMIVSPPGLEVTLLSVCGVDEVMEIRWSQDQAGRDLQLDETRDAVNADPTERREIVLDPGEDYEIVVEWSWQSWSTDSDAIETPPPIDSGAWQAGTPQVFHFGVTEENGTTGNTQDGLNEYVFDPRDLNRYISRVEPEDGRTVLFTEDPVWVHFDIGHVEQLVEKYGRKLVIEVKRTDPDPQPGADLTAVLAPRMGRFGWHNGPQELLSLGEQRINEAILNAPCLPNGPAIGGASLKGTFDLDPLAMYDLDIMAPLTDDSDPVKVMGTRFTTSRYANPEELMEGLGYSVSGQGPFVPDDIILGDPAMTLPSGAMEVSDGLLDEALAAIDADTLPLPTTEGRSYVIWRFTGGVWRIEGLLVDSVETLNRVGAVETTTGSEITTRCKLSSASIGALGFDVIRANENWTRVLLKPASPFGLAPGKSTLALTFTLPDTTLTGTRVVNQVPAILEREGLL